MAHLNWWSTRTDHRASQIVLERAGFTINDETRQTQKYGHTRYEPVVKVAQLVKEYQQAMFDESSATNEGILPAVSMFAGPQECVTTPHKLDSASTASCSNSLT